MNDEVENNKPNKFKLYLNIAAVLVMWGRTQSGQELFLNYCKS